MKPKPAESEPAEPADSEPAERQLQIVCDDDAGGWRLPITARAAGSDAQDRTTLFMASSDEPDRADDVVKQDWRLAEYRANPVVLNNHDTRSVVGYATDVRVPRTGDDAGRLMLRVAWDLDSPDPSIRAVGHQHLAGIRRAGSVGFRSSKRTRRDKLPKESQYYQDAKEIETWWGKDLYAGMLYEGNSLMEFSSVAIPMHAGALQRALRSAATVEERAAAAELPRSEVQALVRGLEAIAESPDGRARLLGLLWPDLLARMRTDPDVRRVVSALVDAGPPPAPVPQSFASLVMGALERIG